MFAAAALVRATARHLFPRRALHSLSGLRALAAGRGVASIAPRSGGRQAVQHSMSSSAAGEQAPAHRNRLAQEQSPCEWWRRPPGGIGFPARRHRLWCSWRLRRHYHCCSRRRDRVLTRATLCAACVCCRFAPACAQSGTLVPMVRLINALGKELLPRMACMVPGCSTRHRAPLHPPQGGGGV